MKVLVLGGTGFIGASVVGELAGHGHQVLGLARSDRAADALTRLGGAVVQGDIREPDRWLAKLDHPAAIIHVAATFSHDMADVDRRLIDALIDRFAGGPRRPRFVGTGGCWLYGPTGDRVVDEDWPFDPPDDFRWMVEARHALFNTASFDAAMVHPAMVYDRDGGVLGMFIEDAQAGGPIRVVESEGVRWPMVHRDDLAVLYRLVLERGRAGTDYNGASAEGVEVGALARAMARRFGLAEEAVVRPVSQVVAASGSWASGFAIDQQMSGARARAELGWVPRHTDPIEDILGSGLPPHPA